MTHRNFIDLEATVDIWHVNVGGFVFDAFLSKHERILSTYELERIGKFLQEKDRLVCLVSRVLLRLALSWYFPCTCPSAWRFSKNTHGKPFLNCDQFPGLEFNLSHSGDIVLCAFTKAGALGVDIETTTSMHDVDGLMARFFAAEEKAFFNTLDSLEKQPLFFRLWTIKESYVKALGAGMQIPFDGFSIQMENLVSGSITLCYEFDRVVRDWQFFLQTYGPDFYPVSIAVITNRQLGLVWRDSSFLKL